MFRYLMLLTIFFYVLEVHIVKCKCAHSYIDGGVSSSDAKTIVNKHNELRKLIANGKVRGQPRGINLKKMKWDEKLAKEAQIIADQCEFNHMKVNDSRWYVGQNLFTTMASYCSDDIEWEYAVQDWFDEYKMYTYGTSSISGTGHYTQVIWATTEYVGCGYSVYETEDYMRYQKLYVCNYGEGGNWVGQVPYKTGSSGCENLC